MSFTDAARELGVTQAAISQRIRLLERHLGQPLFLRHPRGLELTDAGQALVPAVHDAFERLTSGIAEVFGAPADAPLTLRMTPGFAAHWLAPRINVFQAANPGIVLRITSAVWPSDFDLTGVDMEVRYGRGNWEGVDCERLTRERLTPVCAPDMARELLEPRDLAERVLIHSVGFETGWEQWLAKAGVPRLLERTTPLLCDTLAVSSELAVHGAGVALGRSGFTESLFAEKRLAAPFDLYAETNEAFYVVRVTGRTPRPEAGAFWDWITSQRCESQEM